VGGGEIGGGISSVGVQKEIGGVGVVGRDGGGGGVDPCVKLDVTFEGAEHSGLSGVALVLTLLRDFPALQPLFLVVKTLLSEKALDNPYTGRHVCV